MIRSKKYLDKLNSWYTKFKRYTVTYKKGFFHLSNLANSPQTIVESFDKMPFCKHDRERKSVSSDTPFLKAQLYYYELEEGLWVYVSDLRYKKNLLMTNIFDKDLPLDYHFINLHYREKSFVSKSMIINGMILTDKTWSVFKAGNAISDYHFKDSNEKNITIYFTEKWFNTKTQNIKSWGNSSFKAFIESTNTYLLLTDIANESDYFYDSFLKLSKVKDGATRKEETKIIVEAFFGYFIALLSKEVFNEDYFKLSDKDRKYVKHAEKLLFDNLLKEFPGIEQMSRQIGVSPTKLKFDFKTVHNKTLYQYYSFHQMQLAKKLIQTNKHSIKEVAKVLGYDNSSKFTARFKEEFGFLPSEIS